MNCGHQGRIIGDVFSSIDTPGRHVASLVNQYSAGKCPGTLKPTNGVEDKSSAARRKPLWGIGQLLQRHHTLVHKRKHRTSFRRGIRYKGRIAGPISSARRIERRLSRANTVKQRCRIGSIRRRRKERGDDDDDRKCTERRRRRRWFVAIGGCRRRPCASSCPLCPKTSSCVPVVAGGTGVDCASGREEPIQH